MRTGSVEGETGASRASESRRPASVAERGQRQRELRYNEGEEVVQEPPMILTEGMELVVIFFVIMLNLLILVWLQKWSGLT
jgi:hypothetical protein